MEDAENSPPSSRSADIVCVSLDRRAATDALCIWRDAASWLVRRGMPLWDAAIFDAGFVDDALARGLILGATIDSAVAGVALLQWNDELWWPDRPRDSAAYVHKVAVARAYAGRGVVPALIAECERRARTRGLEVVRLDTAADRPRLRSLYEGLGFTAVDLRRVGTFLGLRYEKTLD